MSERVGNKDLTNISDMQLLHEELKAVEHVEIINAEKAKRLAASQQEVGVFIETLTVTNTPRAQEKTKKISQRLPSCKCVILLAFFILGKTSAYDSAMRGGGLETPPEPPSGKALSRTNFTNSTRVLPPIMRGLQLDPSIDVYAPGRERNGHRSLSPSGHTCVYVNAPDGPGTKTGQFYLASSNAVTWDCGSNGPTVIAVRYGTLTIADLSNFSGNYGWAGCCADALGFEGVISLAFSHEEDSMQAEMTTTHYTSFKRTNSLGCEGPVGRSLEQWDGGYLSMWRIASPPGILNTMHAYLWHEGSAAQPTGLGSSAWWCGYSPAQWHSLEGTCGFRDYCAYARRWLRELSSVDIIRVIVAHTSGAEISTIRVRNNGPNPVSVVMTTCPGQIVPSGQTRTFTGYNTFASATMLLQDSVGGAGAINVRIWEPTGATGRRVSVTAQTAIPNSVVIHPDTVFVGRRVAGTVDAAGDVLCFHRASWRQGFTVMGEPGFFASDGQTVDEDWEGT